MEPMSWSVITMFYISFAFSLHSIGSIAHAYICLFREIDNLLRAVHTDRRKFSKVKVNSANCMCFLFLLICFDFRVQQAK